jgi:hypothetical protein
MCSRDGIKYWYEGDWRDSKPQVQIQPDTPTSNQIPNYTVIENMDAEMVTL